MKHRCSQITAATHLFEFVDRGTNIDAGVVTLCCVVIIMTPFHCHEVVIAQCCTTTCGPPGTYKEACNLEQKGCFINT